MNYVARNTPIPHSNKYAVDRFVLVNPDEVTSDREKVLYALWHVGELPYYELLLYTDLKKPELDNVLDELLDKSIIRSSSPKTPGNGKNDRYILLTFKINR